mmetsp:Transcript_22276/g.52674  ORF Transcript_22276/g.52674 Transcript_22276/m.52674 type:complete len:95 (-) Transcript_22276:44-328(-)
MDRDRKTKDDSLHNWFKRVSEALKEQSKLCNVRDKLKEKCEAPGYREKLVAAEAICEQAVRMVRLAEKDKDKSLHIQPMKDYLCSFQDFLSRNI